MGKIEEEVSRTLLLFFVTSICIASLLGILDIISQERRDIQLMLSLMLTSIEYSLVLFIYASFKVLSYAPILEEKILVVKYHKVLSVFILLISILSSFSIKSVILGMIINFILISSLLYLIDPFLNWKSIIFVFPFLISHHYDYLFYIVICYIFLLQEIFYLVESRKLRIFWFITIFSSLPAVFFGFYHMAFVFISLSIILLGRGIYNVIPSKRKSRFLILSTFINLIISMIFSFKDITNFFSYFNLSYFVSLAISVGMIYLDLGKRGHLIRKGNPEKLFLLFLLILSLNTLFGIFKLLKIAIGWEIVLLIASAIGFYYSFFLAYFFGIA